MIDDRQGCYHRPSRRQLLLGGVGVLSVAALGGAHAVATLAQHVTFGAYADNEPWPDLSSHYVLEKTVGARLPTMSWFQSWDTSWMRGRAIEAAARGYDVQLAWEPMRGQVPVRFSDILSGYHDGYLAGFFSAVRDFPAVLWIRPFHEPNGNWYPWSVATGDRSCVTSTEEWVATWRHLVRVQRSIVGSRVRWMWCVNNVDVGGPPAEAYYPGHGYVDALAMDVYNGWGGWSNPYDIVNPMYQRLLALHPTAPIVISEIASREPAAGESHSKATWLRQLFTETRLPRVTHVNFFHAKRERDWRLDSSTGALASVRMGLCSRP